MTADPDHNGEPEQIELPRLRRTLLGRLTHWVEHAQALKGWVQEAREPLVANLEKRLGL